MLVKLTDSCLMGCSHCLDDCKPEGSFMAEETFQDVIRFIENLEIPIALLSGGEPTLHPKFIDFVNELRNRQMNIIVLSNGMWMESEESFTKFYSLPVKWQITNDERFYPRRIKPVRSLVSEPEQNEKFMYFDHVQMISPHGRAKDFPTEKQGPQCFNLRSCNMKYGNLQQAILYLRTKFLKMCTPAINVDGSISAGESKFCYKIGTVKDDMAELGVNLKYMKCTTCGLFEKLPSEYKAAVSPHASSIITMGG